MQKIVDGQRVDMTEAEISAFRAAQPSEAETLAQERAGMSLTFAQLLIGLVAEGWITEAEGDTWLAGTIPQAAVDLIATLPTAQRFAAKARAARPSVILRTDPLTTALAAANGKTDAQLDAFFRTYTAI